MAAAGACVAVGGAPGQTGRPCLTRAERTKRSGPVCARGSSRGGSGGPGALDVGLRVRVFGGRPARHRPHLRAPAADTSAAAAGAHRVRSPLLNPLRLGAALPARVGSPSPTPRRLCGSRGSARSYTAGAVPAPGRAAPPNTHLARARLLGANIDSEEEERPHPRPAPARGRRSSEALAAGVGRQGGVSGTGAPLEQHQMSLFHPPAGGREPGPEEESRTEAARHRFRGAGTREDGTAPPSSPVLVARVCDRCLAVASALRASILVLNPLARVSASPCPSPP